VVARGPAVRRDGVLLGFIEQHGRPVSDRSRAVGARLQRQQRAAHRGVPGDRVGAAGVRPLRTLRRAHLQPLGGIGQCVLRRGLEVADALHAHVQAR
jgi:hypothetical protein